VSGLENAIRNALTRADRSNPEARARIYQSARNALEAGLRKQGINDVETVAAQRHRLELTIHQIEAEERAAAVPPPAIDVDGTRREPESSGEDLMQVEPVRRDRDAQPDQAPAQPDGGEMGDIRPNREDGLRASRPEPAAEAAVPATDHGRAEDIRPERVAKAPKRRGRLFSFLLVVATLVATLGTAVWWVQSSGLLLSPQERDGSVANPEETLTEEDFDGPDPLKEALDAQASFTDDWHEIFKPADTAVLSASAEGNFEPVSTNEGPAVRLTSAAPERDGSVRIEVKPDVLQAMSGKRSTIALTLQSTNGKPVQVSVECAFATLGECGRHRFTVADRMDVLFQVEFDRSLSPTQSGHLLVNSDVGGGGASVNLFGARILPGE
jgi:hypothetical protein